MSLNFNCEDKNPTCIQGQGIVRSLSKYLQYKIQLSDLAADSYIKNPIYVSQSKKENKFVHVFHLVCGRIFVPSMHQQKLDFNLKIYNQKQHAAKYDKDPF